MGLGVSAGVGVFFYKVVGGKINLILTSFIMLPVIALSFCAFFGVWVSNDFHGYEHDFLQGRNF